MKIVLQRVRQATVSVNDQVVGHIEQGIVVFLGVARGDTLSHANMLAEKIQSFRIFADESGKMNQSLLEVKGSVLVVSQFTLLADTSHGRRPSFSQAAAPDDAKMLYESFIDQLRKLGLHVETGVFGAMMMVSLENDGPVTFLLDSTQSTQQTP